MKYILIALILMFSTAAYSASWMKIAKRANGSILYIEESTFVNNGSSLQFWLKTVPGNGQGYTEQHVVILCPSMKSAVVSEKQYDDNRKIVKTMDIKEEGDFLDWKHIDPNSIEDLIAEKYCEMRVRRRF